MKIKGIFLDREKNTDRSLTIALPTPERVAVPLPAGCKASVRMGQWVLRGNSICDGEKAVHASVSGKVEEIRTIAGPDGSFEAVVIKADEEQKDAAVKIPRAEDKESFIAAVKASGPRAPGRRRLPPFALRQPLPPPGRARPPRRRAAVQRGCCGDRHDQSREQCMIIYVICA